MIVVIVLVFIATAYVGLILTFTVGLKRAFDKSADSDNAIVKLSVVVAFKDEEVNLPILLNALLGQTLSQEFFELVFVDDHSADQSLAVVNSYCTRFMNLKIVESPVGSIGKKAALTYGISLSSNPFIVFTDADCLPPEFWLESISNCSGIGADFIIGAVVMNPVNSFARRIQSLEYSSLMATLVGSCGIGHPVIASSANLAFRKECLRVDFESMNPNVASGDDMFLLHKAKALSSCRIEFLNDKRAIVQTSTESTMAKALSQRKRWASKSIHYKDYETIVTGLVVLIFNLSLAILLFTSFFDVKYLFRFSILLVAKAIVDFLLISRYLKFTQQYALLKVFLPLQLAYPFYIVYSFFTGIFIKPMWKGRSIN